MPLLTPQYHQPRVPIWFLVPGLPGCENVINMPVPSGKAGLHSFSPAGPFMTFFPVIPFKERSLYGSDTLGFVTLPVCGHISPVPLPKEIFLSVQQNTLIKISTISTVTAGEPNSPTNQFSVVQPCRSSSQTTCDADQGFPVCAPLSLRVTPAPQSGWTPSFRASVLCHSPLIEQQS